MGILAQAITKSVNEFPTVNNERAWRAITDSTSTYDFYRGNDYENAYPSISKIVNRFMTIAPYAIDANKNIVKNANAVEKLYHANQQMSSVDFREALAVMYLVHPRTHILVWHLENGVAKPGGEITADNIAGYTFLENAVETTVAGKTTYTVNGNTWDDTEVVTLKGMFPYNLARGYAAAEAAKRWSKIDDYIADYQQGFFKNGAIPSGQFIITAPTAKEYRDIVEMMQARHRGAGKNNNVTYAHRPVDPNTGKPAEAQIEWKPFNVDNKNLDLQHIFEQVNMKIDSAYGVPASIRGVGENNNFATAQQDERNFVQNVVDPLTLKIWTRFTHELNRITGGLGYAITYDLELPSVSEDEKIKAERSKTIVDTVIAAVGAGFTVDSIIAAIDAPESFRNLVGNYTPPEKADDMDVDEGDEVEDAPIQPRDGDIVSIKEAAKSKNPKVKKLDEPEQVRTEQKLSEVIKRHMRLQIDAYISQTKDVGDASAYQEEAFVDEMLVVIAAAMIAQGTLSYLSGVTMLQDAGIPTDNLRNFVLSTEARQSYRNYLTRVAQSYMDDTAQSIRNVLAEAERLNWTGAQLENGLRSIMQTDEWRVKRLAITETNRSMSTAAVESMKQIQNEAGVPIEKGLQHTGGDTPCQFCQTLLGKWTPVDKPLVDLDEVVFGSEGGLYINNFAANDGYDIHPNGHCVPVSRVAKTTRTVERTYSKDLELRCKECSGFLRIRPQGTVKGMVMCSKTKCKHENQVLVVNSESSEADIRYRFKEI